MSFRAPLPGLALSGCLAAAVYASLLCPAALNAADTPPRVIGYERAYTAENRDAVAAGQLLLGELNCTSCHLADASLAATVQKKQAPVLDSVTSRVKPQYLLKFLSDPQTVKPGTTMPGVLAHLSEAERAPVVEALVHFLATTGSVTHANPMRQHVTRGEALFHSIGCVACHDPRKDPAAPPLATSLPLGTPSRKYTLPGLTQFLENPLAVRPSGRMPHLNLSPADARDIASFLLNDLDVTSGLQYAYYEGSWDKLPDFSKLTPVEVGDATNFDVSVAKRKDQFALRFDGTIHLEKEGDYRFLIGSDDGSRLLIDDKEVAKVDGMHPFQQARKAMKMTAGSHTVVVEYFEQGGDETLQVDFEGPGTTQLPLATLITAPTAQKGTASPTEEFVVDVAKAAKGREHFASLGCASCHELKQNGQVVASTATTPALVALSGRGGCLESTAGLQPARIPRYNLSSPQQAAISAALTATKSPAKALPPEAFVSRTLVRFNCIACHERGELGGVEGSRNAHFQSDMPEMGDEGRLPPHLTGVGAKLNPEWLRTVFDQGPKDRPYMFTRMPKFGTQNVGELIVALEQADAAAIKPAPAFELSGDDEKRFKATGRRLVGAQGFSCIKCHTFADKRSTGIQALSLTTMTKRLRREWFHHYMQSPLAYRPGTRMPTPYPDGKTTLPDILEGSIDKQTGSIWTYLGDADQALLPVGLVTGDIELMAFDEAIVYRNFIEGAGTRAIGVGYPEKLNLAFDANNQRLALLWHGAFIDAAKHWTGRGAGFEGPLGDNILRLSEGPAFAALESNEAEWPKQTGKELGYQFRGYRLGEKRAPTFTYSWNGLKIEDYPRPVGDQDLYTMQRTITVTADKPANSVWFRPIAAAKIEKSGEGAFKIDDKWTLRVAGASKPELRQSAGKWEVLVPVAFEGQRATIEITYDW